jgi:hypothetical protein
MPSSDQAAEKGFVTSKRTLKGAAANDTIIALRFGSRPALRGVISFSSVC